MVTVMYNIIIAETSMLRQLLPPPGSYLRSRSSSVFNWLAGGAVHVLVPTGQPGSCKCWLKALLRAVRMLPSFLAVDSSIL